MATKANFSREEWTTILQSVPMASMAVTAADPSGLWGMLKESIASGRALLEAKTDASSNELVKAVAADFGTSEGRTAAREGLQAKLSGTNPAEIKSKAIAALREVSSLLDAKAPADAPGFKAWLHHVAQVAAEAATEGGFLGFGGVQVSDAEKATLAEISTALGVSGRS